MRLQQILVAVDFSDYDQPALETAAALAREGQAKVLIAHVHESPMAYGGDEYQGDSEPTTDQLRNMLESIAPSDTTCEYEHHLLQGEGIAALRDTDIARAIVRFADERQVDLIILGTHGRSGVSRVLMGSIAEKVVGRANQPVLTLKLPQGAS